MLNEVKEEEEELLSLQIINIDYYNFKYSSFDFIENSFVSLPIIRIFGVIK